jgi:hypothetical protein
MFPTCSEILEVIRDLGYMKSQVAPVVLHPEAVATSPRYGSRRIVVDEACGPRRCRHLLPASPPLRATREHAKDAAAVFFDSLAGSLRRPERAAN